MANTFSRSPLDALIQNGLGASAPAASPAPSAKPAAPTARQITDAALPPEALQPLFMAASQQYQVPINVLAALAQQESNYNPRAIGQPTQYGHAKGIMQNIDATAKGLGIDPFDAEQSIMAAAKQLRQRLDNGDSMEDAIKAHFAGDDRAQWGEKTAVYGQEVADRAQQIGKLYASLPQQAPQTQDQLQQQLDQQQPGRYTVLTPEQAQRYQQRQHLMAGGLGFDEAAKAFGGANPPSPLTAENQQRVRDASQVPSPISNDVRAQVGQANAAERDRIRQQNEPQQTMQPWEPTLGERIAGLIPGNKDRAAVELAAREGAAEKGVTPEDIYAAAGGYRPAINPEGRAPIRAAAQAATTLAPQVADIAPGAVNTVLRAIRGGDMGGERDWLDKAIKATDIEQPKDQDPNYDALQGVGQSLGYSLVSMAAGITSGAVGSLAGPVAGAGAGMAGSGAVSYRASRDQFLDQVRDALSAKTQQIYGRPMTDNEWQAVAKDYDAAATKYGAWEAIPEAASNLIVVKSLARPLSAYKGTAKLGEIAKRVAETQASEQSTELATSIGQNQAQVDAGLAQEQSPAQILRQQGLNIALTTGLMAGAGSAGRHALDKIQARRAGSSADSAADQVRAQQDEAAAQQMQQAAEQGQAAEPALDPASLAPAAGPLTRSASTAQQASGEPVTARSPDGDVSGTLQSLVPTPGGWIARVEGEDGTLYDFTQDDGVQLLQDDGQPLRMPSAEAQQAQADEQQQAEAQQKAGEAQQEAPKAEQATELTPFERNTLRGAGITDEQLANMPADVARTLLERVQQKDEAKPEAKASDPQADLARMLGMSEDDYIQAINPSGERISSDDVIRLERGDITAPKGAADVSSFTDKTGRDIRVLRSDDGSMYAVDPKGVALGYVGPFEDGKTVVNVLDAEQANGIGKGLMLAYTHENPLAPAGGLSAGGEKTMRSVYRTLKAEQQGESSDAQLASQDKPVAEPVQDAETQQNQPADAGLPAIGDKVELGRGRQKATVVDVTPSTVKVNVGKRTEVMEHDVYRKRIENAQKAASKPTAEEVAAAHEARKMLPNREKMAEQHFDSSAGVGKIYASQIRGRDGEFGVSWASTDIATASSMEEAAAVAKAVAESGADNITDMRKVAKQHQAKAEKIAKLERQAKEAYLRYHNGSRDDHGVLRKLDRHEYIQTERDRLEAARLNLEANRLRGGDVGIQASNYALQEQRFAKDEADYQDWLKQQQNERQAAEKAGKQEAKSEQPKRKSKKEQAAEALRKRAEYFTPGNIVPAYAGTDKVVAYYPGDAEGNGWHVEVHQVEKRNGEWVATGPVRSHTTGSTDVSRVIDHVPVDRRVGVGLGQFDPGALPQNAVLEDAEGKRWLVMRGRHDWVKAQPVQEGVKPEPSADAATRFNLREGDSLEPGEKAGPLFNTGEVFDWDSLKFKKLARVDGQPEAQAKAEAPAKKKRHRDEPAAELPESAYDEPGAENVPTEQPKAYGADNKLVSVDRAAEVREKLRKKLLGGQLNAGIDPEVLALGTELAVFHIEAGVRQFAAFAKTIADDLGMSVAELRPLLRGWYNGARDMMEDHGVSIDGMDEADTVRAALKRLDDTGSLDEAKPEQKTGDPLLDNPASWVIRNKETGEVIAETFDRKKVDALNRDKYEAVPIAQHLRELNQKIKQDAEPQPDKPEAASKAPGAVQTVVTPAGREIQVRNKVVEAADLVTSHSLSGNENKAYPQELQPRDRSRAASLDQVNQIAAKLNPKLLGDSPTTTDGAPIVSPENVVESGNGRSMAIRKAYANGNEASQTYRQHLADLGYDVEGMKAPVLVRERITPLSPDELRAYTVESNDRTTLDLSAAERGQADARKVGDIIHLYQGGDLNAAQNRDFVRAFLDTVGAADRGNLVDAQGLLSQTGRRRLEGALLSAAYGDAGLVSDVFESGESDIKAIGGALLDSAGRWAQMRKAAADGIIPGGMDITPNLLEAVNLIRQARAEGRPVAELARQDDIFSGELAGDTRALLHVFYRGENLARARSRDKVAEALAYYTDTALGTKAGANLFGDAELSGADVLGQTNDRLNQEDRQGASQTDLFASPRPAPADAGAPGGKRQGQGPEAGTQPQQQGVGGEHVPSSRTDLERDSANAAHPEPNARPDDGTAAGQNDGSAGPAGGPAGAERGNAQRSPGVSPDGAAAVGEHGDQPLHQADGQVEPARGAAGSAQRTRGGRHREQGEGLEQARADAIIESAPAAGTSDDDQRLAAQKQANDLPTKVGDRANLDAALPLLFPEQRDDVAKAEARFEKHNGILYTNGTGTGKTATGAGIMKRLINAGRDNIAVIVPSKKIANDWIRFTKKLGIQLKLLGNKGENGGSGPVITTYANFADNPSLIRRDWDAFIADESHYLTNDQDGTPTKALHMLRALTGHPGGEHQAVTTRFAKQWQALTAAAKDRADANGNLDIPMEEYARREAVEAKARKAWEAVAKPYIAAYRQRWEKQLDIPKVTFLSATPFAYDKSVIYGDGFLYHFTEPARAFYDGDARGYNQADDRGAFLMQHFGYRMRTGKLTAPESGVDSQVMEQAFNQWLKDQGALSGRRLEVDHDYDRRFVLIDDAIGTKIDKGLEYLREADDGKYREVYDAVSKQFDYQRRMYLLESLKARAAIPMIRQHLAMGRKVVLFHDFNQGGGYNPFTDALREISDAKVKEQARAVFAAHPELFKLDFTGLLSPRDAMLRAFPDALMFNGSVDPDLRIEYADQFNDDNSGKDLIVVQSDAGREGVSLHDTTGKHPRVLINLGMPVRPVASTQIEGRIYRTGQASDAAFRYLTTGTGWEAYAFATKIAGRASTAENLALGHEARGLKEAFIQAYQEAGEYPASADDGKGGKELDRGLARGRLSPYERAKTFYWAQQKNSKRRDQREGTDYYATPEPIGYKMVEWANPQDGESMLEPSAGHGAIARFFPERGAVTMVEPSYQLSQRAALARGDARIINDTFENLHVTNKYDVIAMNPPYGVGGKTSTEHLAKAATHLRNGGRIVALLPRGGKASERLDAFLASPEAENLYTVARVSLPGVLFERAGTGVNSEIVVLEKQNNPDDGALIQARHINLSNAQDVNEIFDRLEHIGMPERIAPSEPEAKEEIIEHVTKGGKGKTLRGVVRQGITQAEAEAIDPGTFRKNGGWFLRLKRLQEAGMASRREDSGAQGDYSAKDISDSLTAGEFGPFVRELIDSGRLLIHEGAPLGDSSIQGFTDSDNVMHLYAGNLTPETAPAVLLHEAFHAGAEQLHSDRRWQNIQAQLGRQLELANRGQGGEFFRKAAQRVQRAGVEDRQAQLDEFAAYAIEHYEQAPKGLREWIDRAIGAIKDFVSRHFGIQLGRLDAAQLRALAATALRARAIEARNLADEGLPDGERSGAESIYLRDEEGRPVRYSKNLADQFDDLAGDAAARSMLEKIAPERLPQRLRDRWNQLTDNLALRIRTAGVDRYAPLLRNDQLLHGEDTLEGSIASSGWALARMSGAAGGALHAMLNNGRLYLDDKEKVLDIREGSKGLFDSLKQLGSAAEIQRFMSWIVANRANRLMAEGREHLFTADEIAAGMKMSGGKLANGKSRSILYAKVWGEFQQFRDDVLGVAEQSGIITPEQRQTWANEFYVPFYRVIDADSVGGPTRSGKDGLSKQQAYKRLKGGRQALRDPLENTLLNFHHLLQASLRNQAALQAMDNANQLGIATPTSEARRDKKASTFVMRDGEKQWYNISDNLTFKALTALSDAGLNSSTMKVGRWFKRLFTNLTTITPQFAVANFIRDSLSAMATSPTSAVPFKTALNGMITYGKSGDRARMLASGAAFSFGNSFGDNADEIRAAIESSARGARVIADPKLIPSTLMRAWHAWHGATDYMENANRAGIWKENQSKGKLKAAFEARDLMDFGARGDAAIIRILTDVVPFLNARIQGLDKLYRAGVKTGYKVATRQAKAADKQQFARFAAVIGAMTLMSMALYLRNKDDEDYRKLEDWQRDAYWPVKIGNSMFFIPKPFEVGSIATMGERILEQFVDPTVGGDKLKDRFLSMLGDTFSFNPTPQAIKPPLELMANKDWFSGRPIEDQGMQKLSPSLRYRPDTTRMAQATSRVMESAMGNAALSPVQIDYLIRGYLGQVGQTAMGMADTMWRRAMGESQPSRHWYEYQPMRRFYKDLGQPDAYTRYATDFYNELKESDQAYSDVMFLQKYGDKQGVADLKAEKGDKIAEHTGLAKVAAGMSKINAKIRQVQMNAVMDGDQKRAAIDALLEQKNAQMEAVGKALEQRRVKQRAAN